MSAIETGIISAESEPLENKLRLEMDIAIFKLCGLEGNDNILPWIEKHDDRLTKILNYDEEVKKIAREGDIEQAAKLAKEKLDSWFGYDVAG